MANTNYETGDYVEIREEDGGYRIYSRGYTESRNWRGDGVKFTNRADAETVARLTAKACYAEDMRTRVMAAEATGEREAVV